MIAFRTGHEQCSLTIFAISKKGEGKRITFSHLCSTFHMSLHVNDQTRCNSMIKPGFRDDIRNLDSNQRPEWIKNCQKNCIVFPWSIVTLSQVFASRLPVKESMHYWLRPTKRGQFRFANFAPHLWDNVGRLQPFLNI